LCFVYVLSFCSQIKIMLCCTATFLLERLDHLLDACSWPDSFVQTNRGWGFCKHSKCPWLWLISDLILDVGWAGSVPMWVGLTSRGWDLFLVHLYRCGWVLPFVGGANSWCVVGGLLLTLAWSVVGGDELILVLECWAGFGPTWCVCGLGGFRPTRVTEHWVGLDSAWSWVLWTGLELPWHLYSGFP